MGLFDKMAIEKASMKLIEPIGNLKENITYLVSLYSEHLIIKDVLTRKDATLSLNQITNVFYGTETEVIEKSKSVVGRAIIGSAFGPMGTVVGAISGVGDKKSKKKHTYLIISYISSDGNEDVIKLEDTLSNGKNLYKKLNALIGKADVKHAIL